jgi:hypothetical protein
MDANPKIFFVKQSIENCLKAPMKKKDTNKSEKLNNMRSISSSEIYI